MNRFKGQLNVNENENYMRTLETYDDYVAFLHEINLKRRLFIEQRLREHYPTRFCLFYSIAIILIGIIELTLQVLIIVEKSPLYYISNGIWGGVGCILVGILCIVSSKRRGYRVYMTSLVVNALLFAITVAAFIALPIASLQYKNTCRLGEDCVKSQTPLIIVMLVFGVGATVLCFTFITFLPIKVNGGCFNSSTYEAFFNENQDQPIQNDPINIINNTNNNNNNNNMTNVIQNENVPDEDNNYRLVYL